MTKQHTNDNESQYHEKSHALQRSYFFIHCGFLNDGTFNGRPRSMVIRTKRLAG